MKINKELWGVFIRMVVFAILLFTIPFILQYFGIESISNPEDVCWDEKLGFGPFCSIEMALLLVGLLALCYGTIDASILAIQKALEIWNDKTILPIEKESFYAHLVPAIYILLMFYILAEVFSQVFRTMTLEIVYIISMVLALGFKRIIK
jgi:hypothetical protein